MNNNQYCNGHYSNIDFICLNFKDGLLICTTSNAGVRPALDTDFSVFRVGFAALLNAMKQIAGFLKLELARFREVEIFSRLKVTLDAITQSLINKGTILIAVLLKKRQDLPMCMPLQLSTLCELIFTESGLWNLLSDLSLCYKVKLISKKKEHAK